MFEILETEKTLESGAEITIVPKGGTLLPDLLATAPPLPRI